jgi:AraC-like DNA-binding protein
MQSDFELQEPGTDAAASARLVLLLVEMARNLKGPGLFDRPRDTRERLQRLRLEVRRHCGEPWSVPQMARKVMLSTPRFASLYKHTFGVSPMEDVIRHRLELAEQLLAGREMTVKQVAARCGFKQHSYFTRLFRERVGCTPGSYR